MAEQEFKQEVQAGQGQGVTPLSLRLKKVGTNNDRRHEKNLKTCAKMKVNT